MDAGESKSAEKTPTNKDEATLQRIDTWQMLHPEVLQTTTQTPNQTNNPQLPSRTDTSSSSSNSSQDLLHEALNDESDAFIELKDTDPSPMNAPPAQEMERDASYDPERIPKYVFSNNDASAPNEWSVVSNESLFSIHQGSNSFGGEHAFEEVNVDDESRVTEKEEVKGKRKGGSHERVKVKSPNAGKLKGSSSSVSDGSECSDYSFAFPVLGKHSKAETRGPRNQSSRDEDAAAEEESTASKPSFPHKTTFFSRLFNNCCCCRRCLSCFSRISCPSCCKRVSCPSCCKHISCKPCCSHLSCLSCCRRVSCKSCCSRISSLPCCSWSSCWHRRH